MSATVASKHISWEWQGCYSFDSESLHLDELVPYSEHSILNLGPDRLRRRVQGVV